MRFIQKDIRTNYQNYGYSGCHKLLCQDYEFVRVNGRKIVPTSEFEADKSFVIDKVTAHKDDSITLWIIGHGSLVFYNTPTW